MLKPSRHRMSKKWKLRLLKTAMPHLPAVLRLLAKRVIPPPQQGAESRREEE